MSPDLSVLFIMLLFIALLAIGYSSSPNPKKYVLEKYDSLNTAAEDYAKALQEISNYGSREMLKSINPNVDKYVAKG